MSKVLTVSKVSLEYLPSLAQKAAVPLLCVGVTDMSREGREIPSVTQVVVVVRGKGVRAADGQCTLAARAG